MLGERLLRRPQTLLIRRVLFQLHLWVGIGAGTYIFIMGVTGASLVFREEIEQRANPGLYPMRVDDSTAPVVDVIHNIETAYPDHRVTSVYSPTKGRPVYYAFIERDRRFRTVLVSPAGAVLGERPETGLVRWLQDLHVNLLAGTTGRVVNGVGATCLLLLCLTGPLIWWPGVATWRRGLRADFRKNWRRVIWELHSAVGIWTALVIGMWAVTGVYFTFPQPFQKVIGRLSPLTAPRAVQSDLSKGPARSDLGALIARAQDGLPGGHVAGVVLPTSARGSVLVQMSRFQPDHLDNTGYVHFTFDQYSGALLGQWDQVNRSPGDAVLSWMQPLHFGAFGGVGVRVLWVLLGLAPSLLFATGGVMWWNRVLRRRWIADDSGPERLQPRPNPENQGPQQPPRRAAS